MLGISISKRLVTTVILVSGATFLAIASPLVVNAQESIIYTTEGSNVNGGNGHIVGRDYKAAGIHFTAPADYVDITAIEMNLFAGSSYEDENIPFNSTAVAVSIYEFSTSTMTAGSFVAVTESLLLSGLDYNVGLNRFRFSSEVTLNAGQDYLIFTAITPSSWTYPTSQYAGLIHNVETNYYSAYAHNRAVRIGLSSDPLSDAWSYGNHAAPLTLVSGSELYNGLTFDNPLGAEGVYAVDNTRFLAITASGVSTGTVQFTADYFLDENEYDSSVSALNPTAVDFSWSLRPSTDFSSRGESISLVNGTSSVSTTVSGLADGTYDLAVGFTNVGCTTGLSDCPFPQSYAYSSFTIASGTFQGLDPVELYDASTFADPSTPYRECGLSDLGGCIANTFIYLFYPSTASTDAFTTTYSDLQNKIPFVYAYQAADMITGMFSGGSQSVPSISYTTGIGEITFISQDMINNIPYVALLRSLIEAGLWLMLFTVIYRKTLRIHDNVTV